MLSTGRDQRNVVCFGVLALVTRRTLRATPWPLRCYRQFLNFSWNSAIDRSMHHRAHRWFDPVFETLGRCHLFLSCEPVSLLDATVYNGSRQAGVRHGREGCPIQIQRVDIALFSVLFHLEYMNYFPSSYPGMSLDLTSGEYEDLLQLGRCLYEYCVSKFSIPTNCRLTTDGLCAIATSWRFIRLCTNQTRDLTYLFLQL